jgi:hypothetical protein
MLDPPARAHIWIQGAFPFPFTTSAQEGAGEALGCQPWVEERPSEEEGLNFINQSGVSSPTDGDVNAEENTAAFRLSGCGHGCEVALARGGTSSKGLPMAEGLWAGGLWHSLALTHGLEMLNRRYILSVPLLKVQILISSEGTPV